MEALRLEPKRVRADPPLASGPLDTQVAITPGHSDDASLATVRWLHLQPGIVHFSRSTHAATGPLELLGRCAGPGEPCRHGSADA